MLLTNHRFLSRCASFKWTLTLLTLALVLTGTRHRAAAQEPAPPTANTSPSTPPKKDDQQDLSNLSLEDLMKIKVHSVYSASKFLQKVTEAPASVSIITAEDIKRYGYTTLAAAIRSVRGFYVNYTRSYSDLGARGFARPGDFNTRVLLLVDGHRISDNVYSSALIGPEFHIDMDLIDRIEIIRGPSSSLYGTNAFFGVINVITKRGDDFDGVEVSASTGSQNSHQERVSYGKRFRSGFDLLLSATLADSKGNESLFFKEFADPATNNGFAENADGQDVNQLFANLSWREFSLQGVYGDRRKHIPTASFGTDFNDPGNYTEDAHGYLDFKYNKSFGESAEFVGRLYYDHYNYHGNYIYSLEGDNGPIRAVANDSAYGVWWGSEATLTARLSKRYKLTGGAEYRNNVRQDQKSYFEDPFIQFSDDERDSREWAGYVENQFRLSKNLLLNGGVRYDHSSAYGGSTNPRFALVYNPLAKTTVKFLYGQAFRAPNVYELRVRDESSVPGTLTPETIKTAEVVVEQYLGDYVRVAGSAFTYRIRNLISQIEDPQSNIPTFINVGRIKSSGIESEIEVKSNPGLQGLFSYAYQSSRDMDTGATLSNSPAHMVKLNLYGNIVL